MLDLDPTYRFRSKFWGPMWIRFYNVANKFKPYTIISGDRPVPDLVLAVSAVLTRSYFLLLPIQFKFWACNEHPRQDNIIITVLSLWRTVSTNTQGLSSCSSPKGSQSSDYTCISFSWKWLNDGWRLMGMIWGEWRCNYISLKIPVLIWLNQILETITQSTRLHRH